MALADHLSEDPDRPFMYTCGVDYLRATYGSKKEIAQIQNQYSDICVRAALAETGEVADGKFWGWLGYKGAAHRTASWGYGTQGYILQASGGIADIVARDDFAFDNIPRLDVQVTIWGYHEPAAVPALVADRAVSWRDTHRPRAKVRLVRGFGGGDTAYLGAKTSDSYIRIYDKGAEASDEAAYAQAVRWEIEYHDDKARLAYKYLQGEGFTDGALVSLVKGEAAAWGLRLPDTLGNVQNRKIHIADTTDGDAASLRWLAGPVRSTIERLERSGYSRAFILRTILGERWYNLGEGIREED